MSDLILAAYLTSRSDPQRKPRVPTDSFAYIRPWYTSMTRLGLTGSSCTPALRRPSSSATRPPGLASCARGRARGLTNDARFFAYQRLLGRVRAGRVFLTDISDVTIVQDPFSASNA